MNEQIISLADYKKQVNTEIQFRDQSTNSPTSWSWTFGDGTTSATKDPKKTYTTIGTYTVTLVATNACGSCSSITKTVEIVESLPKEEGAGELIMAVGLAALVIAYLVTRKK